MTSTRPRHAPPRTGIQRRAFLAHAATAAGLAAAPWLAHASPGIDTLKIIVGFAPGGTADTVGRRVGSKLAGTYARSVVVENRSGAGGQIAIQAVKGMAADGSAILVTPASMLMIYPHIYRKLSYDPVADLTPLSMACTLDFGLGVGPLGPDSVTTVAQFLAWVKTNPAGASFGSPAPGSVPHFIGELLARAGSADLRHVPYRGSQPAMLDLIGGQIAAVSAPVGEFLQHLGGGKVRLLATSGATRSRFAPGIQTYAEQGLKDLQFNEWFGFFAPGRLPAPQVAALNASLRQSLAASDVIEGLATMGLEAAGSDAGALASRLKADLDRWGPIVKRIGFTADS